MLRKQKMFLFAVCTVVLCIFFLPSNTFADTIVSTDINTDTTWSVDASPYVVQSDIHIGDTATLTIDAGVEVLVDPGIKIFVDGNMVSDGSADAQVFFDAHVADTDWGGIVFSDLASGVFTYSTFSHTSTVLAADDADISITNSMFSFVDTPGSITLATDFTHRDNTFLVTNLAGWNIAAGDTIEDRILTKGDGVYQIGGEISIAEDTTLTIATGVSIEYTPSARINIFGSLVARGTADAHISIKNSSDYGIYAFTGANLDFAYTDILNGTINISGGILSFVQGSIVNTSERSIWAYGATATIADSVFDGGNTGIDTNDNSTFVIKNTDIKNKWEGIRVGYKSSLDIDGMHMQNIQGIGIQAYGDATINIANGEIVQTGRGIMASYGCVVKVERSLIDTFTDYYGILVSGSQLQISDSEIKNGDTAIDQYLGSLVGKNVKIHDVVRGVESIGQSGDGTKFKIQLHDSEIYNTTDYALRLFDLSADSEIRNNSIYSTAGNNVFYDGTGLDISKNWWGSKTGPDPASMAPDAALIQYAPWLKYDPKNSRVPVIIIPGITGTRLLKAYDNNEEIWPDMGRLIFSLSDTFLNSLILKSNGTEDLTYHMIPGDIVRSAPLTHIFDKLIEDLENKNGYIENQDLFVFPYDWRFDSKTSADKLKEKIDQVLEQTGYDKVDIIAHSMGGLVTKRYISEYDDSKIDKLFFVGTPHLGAPKAFKALMYGDNLGMSFILNNSEIKKISQNFPSIYELLPSQNFGNYINYLGSNLQYGGTENLMIDEGRNANMFNFAHNLHGVIDTPPTYTNTQVYNIAGCSTKTIGSISIWKNKKNEEEYSLNYVEGDETVPLKSADGIQQGSHLYSDMGTHGELPSIFGVRDFITNSIKGNIASLDTSISTNTNICLQSGKSIEIHSPVTLDIYDDQGRHTGPTADGSIEYNIPNISYNIIGEQKFAYLPDGPTYRVVQHAEHTGTYDMYIHSIGTDDSITSSAYFTSLPISTEKMSGELSITPTSTTYTVSLDQDGDGAPDTIVASKETLEIPNTNITNSVSHSGGIMLQTKESLKSIEKSPEITKESAVQKTKIEKKLYKKVRNAATNVGIQNTENQTGNIENPTIQKSLTERWYLRLRAIIKKLFIR